MSLALFVSMALQLDRPYWAMVAAIFLQIRPESGLVIEKALCLIVGGFGGWRWFWHSGARAPDAVPLSGAGGAC